MQAEVLRLTGTPSPGSRWRKSSTRFMSPREAPPRNCSRRGGLVNLGTWISLICLVEVDGAGCACSDTMSVPSNRAPAVGRTIHCTIRAIGSSVAKMYMLQSGKIRKEVPIMAQDQDVSRRDFVKTAGAVAAVAAAIPAVHGAPAVQKVRAANDQGQFGIIGTGSPGSYLLKHLKRIDNR